MIGVRSRTENALIELRSSSRSWTEAVGGVKLRSRSKVSHLCCPSSSGLVKPHVKFRFLGSSGLIENRWVAQSHTNALLKQKSEALLTFLWLPELSTMHDARLSRVRRAARTQRVCGDQRRRAVPPPRWMHEDSTPPRDSSSLGAVSMGLDGAGSGGSERRAPLRLSLPGQYLARTTPSAHRFICLIGAMYVT